MDNFDFAGVFIMSFENRGGGGGRNGCFSIFFSESFYVVQAGPSICGGTDHDTVNRVVVVVGEFAFAASQGYRINTATNRDRGLEGNRAKQYCVRELRQGIDRRHYPAN